MSKNNLLKEGTIRRFMKLAGTGVIASDFLKEDHFGNPIEEEVAEEEVLDVDLGAAPEGEEAEFEVAEEEPADEVTLDDEEVEALVAAFDAAEAVVEKLRGTEAEAPEELEVGEMEVEEDDMTGEPMEMDFGAEEELEEDQGYADKEDESLGMRTGKESDKEQSYKARRDDSYGKWGKRDKEKRNVSLEEDKPFTAKKERPGADKRKGAKKRGAEGTLAKTKGHGNVDFVAEALRNIDYVDEEKIAEELYERVSKRLVKEARMDKVASQLASKIARHLKK